VTARQIVLDANIIIRAVLGKKVGPLLERHADTTRFCAPLIAFTDTERIVPQIMVAQGITPANLTMSLDVVQELVEEIPVEVTNPWHDAALERIGPRDPDDWPILAAALAYDCPVWTEDSDFFGVGVPTWTSALVHIYLRGENKASAQES
jgi:predicted nucleic acid-binding protein